MNIDVSLVISLINTVLRFVSTVFAGVSLYHNINRGNRRDK